ncbi:MAG TPA: glycosyltransferase, partial [Phycisphaerae bacterium]
ELSEPLATGRAEYAFPKARPTFRILHLTSSIAPSAGGPATVVARLAAAQAAMGHHVTIVSSLDCAERASFEVSVRNIPYFDRVHLLLCPWTSHFQRWFGKRLSPIYESALPFMDVLHIHGMWEPMLLVAAKLARKHKVPYIVRPCGTLDPWSLGQSRWKKRVALAVSRKKMLDGAALIHTLNKEEARLIEPLHIAAPSAIIPNGVFLDEIDDTPSDDRLFARFPALLEHPYILFLGRLHHKKGLDILAEAFGRIAGVHRDVHLLVAGPDRGAQRAFLREIQRLGLRERVHIAGPLVGPAKLTAYRNATCFCLPSRQEGFSLSITEALATRVPVAISTECHFPEVKEIGAGVVFPLNGKNAAEGLNAILTATAPERIRMGNAGRKLVEEQLTWERIAGMTLEAYGRLIPE